MSASPYRDPQALRQALTDRLRRFAQERGGMELTALQRQFAYDRLLYRVFSADADRWVVKGATAMLARLAGAARHTRDIDLYSRTGDLDDADRALRQAAAMDAGDHFRFTLTPGRRVVAQGADAIRVPVVAFIGIAEFARFHVDLVTDLEMTGTPDEVPPLVAIDMPGLARRPYRAYPLADHIADKVCALLEEHPRIGGPAVASTRYRDLVDLTTFAHTATLEATGLAVALRSEARRRGLTLPDRLPVPTGPGWAAGYARVARNAPGAQDRDLDAAMATAGRFVDPVLSDEPAGRWDPVALRWKSTEA